MAVQESEKRPEERNDFADAAKQASPGFFSELWEFMRHNKKWWLIPVIVVLLLVGVLGVLGSSAKSIQP